MVVPEDPDLVYTEVEDLAVPEDQMVPVIMEMKGDKKNLIKDRAAKHQTAA
jgi:hypothetical protein